MDIQAEDLSNIRGAADVEYSALLNNDRYESFIQREPLSILDDFVPAPRSDEL